MGATASTLFNNVIPHPVGIYSLVAGVRRWRSRFQTLKLTEKDVAHLYDVYKHADLTLKNSVKTAHLMSYLKVEDIQFAKRMLSAFNSGAKFEGFVFEIWNLCTIDETDLADFVFDMYDPQRLGDVSAAQAQVMLKELYGEAFFKEDSKKSKDIMSQLFNTEDVSLGVEKFQFREFTKKQPSVLFLAFSVQKSLIRGVVGFSFWRTQSQHRRDFSEPELAGINVLRVDILSGRCPIAAEDLEEEKTEKNAKKNLSVRDRSFHVIDNRGHVSSEAPSTPMSRSANTTPMSRSANTSTKNTSSKSNKSFRKVGREKDAGPPTVTVSICNSALTLDAGLGIVSIINNKQRALGVSKKESRRRVMDNANLPVSYVTDHTRDLASRLSSPTGADLLEMEEKMSKYEKVEAHKLKLEHPGTAALEEAMDLSRKGGKKPLKPIAKATDGGQSSGSEGGSEGGTAVSSMFKEKLRALSPIKTSQSTDDEKVSKKTKKSPKKKATEGTSHRYTVQFDIPEDGRAQSDGGHQSDTRI